MGGDGRGSKSRRQGRSASVSDDHREQRKKRSSRHRSPSSSRLNNSPRNYSIPGSKTNKIFSSIGACASLFFAFNTGMLPEIQAQPLLVDLFSVREYSKGIQHAIGGNDAIRISALAVFALLGFPLSITYSVPFSITAELTADTGGGQGLAIGVLNLAIVVAQMIISLGAGPWDALFGGGNIPAFVLASFFALVVGVIAILKLPTISSSACKPTGFHFG